MKITSFKQKCDITSSSREKVSKQEPQKHAKTNISDSACCLESVGKAQVLMQNKKVSYETKEKQQEEITDLMNKIYNPKGMQVGRMRGDNRFSVGRPVEGFAKLFYDDVRGIYKEDENGKLLEIYTIEPSKVYGEIGIVNVYDADGNVKKSFSNEEMVALKEYKYHPEAIHNKLREGKEIGIQSHDELTGWINSLDELFNNDEKCWTTTEPTVVYRALPDKLTYEQIDALSSIGSVFNEASYSSTTTDLNVAKRFQHKHPILEIELPQNSKYIDMDSLFNIDMKHWIEHEVLLPRNQNFMVTGFDESKNLIKVKLI